MHIQLIYHLNFLPNSVIPSVFPLWRPVNCKKKMWIMLHFSYQINKHRQQSPGYNLTKWFLKEPSGNTAKRTEGSAELWVWLLITSIIPKAMNLHLISTASSCNVTRYFCDTQDQQFHFKLILNSVWLFKCPVWFVSCKYGIRK